MPFTVARSELNVLRALESSFVPSTDLTSTWIGSVAPAGRLFCRVFSAMVDSASPGRLELKSNDGLKPTENTASTARTPPDASTKRTGCAPSDLPIDVNRAPSRSVFHDLEGQNSARPRSETTAGTSVNEAIKVTATAMARAGPIERKMLSDERI